MNRLDPARLLAHEIEPGLIALDLRLRALLERHELEGVEACLAEVEALRALVRDFQLEPESGPFPLSPLLQALAARFGPIASARGVGLYLDSSEARVTGDSRATERILSNLLSNAISHSPPGEKVAVRVRPDSRVVVVEVEDRGIGIPPEDHERIFEAFTRLDPEREGSGLGLAIARRLAEAQRGTLTLTSDSGRGSRFTLTLPAA